MDSLNPRIFWSRKEDGQSQSWDILEQEEGWMDGVNPRIFWSRREDGWC